MFRSSRSPMTPDGSVLRDIRASRILIADRPAAIRGGMIGGGTSTTHTGQAIRRGRCPVRQSDRPRRHSHHAGPRRHRRGNRALLPRAARGAGAIRVGRHGHAADRDELVQRIRLRAEVGGRAVVIRAIHSSSAGSSAASTSASAIRQTAESTAALSPSIRPFEQRHRNFGGHVLGTDRSDGRSGDTAGGGAIPHRSRHGTDRARGPADRDCGGGPGHHRHPSRQGSQPDAPTPPIRLDPHGPTSDARRGAAQLGPGPAAHWSSPVDGSSLDDLMAFMVELGDTMVDSGDPVTHVSECLERVAQGQRCARGRDHRAADSADHHAARDAGVTHRGRIDGQVQAAAGPGGGGLHRRGRGGARRDRPAGSPASDLRSARDLPPSFGPGVIVLGHAVIAMGLGDHSGRQVDRTSRWPRCWAPESA